MEIAIFLAMMIVPFISIAALVMALMNVKRVDALKRLTLRIVDRERPEVKRGLIDEYTIDEV